MRAGERNLARGKHQYKMLKQDDGPSVLNNSDHKLTSRGETSEILSNLCVSLILQTVHLKTSVF